MWVLLSITTISGITSKYRAFIKYTHISNSFPGYTNENIDMRSFATSRGDWDILFGIWYMTIPWKLWKCGRFEKYGNMLVSASIVKKLRSILHRCGSEKYISVTPERYILVQNHFREKLCRQKKETSQSSGSYGWGSSEYSKGVGRGNRLFWMLTTVWVPYAKTLIN